MYSSVWLSHLQSARFAPLLLFTACFDRQDFLRYPHPAMAPRSLRAATGVAEVTARDGTVYPFWPNLTEWPGLKREWSPQERRAPVASMQASLTALAEFPHDAIQPGLPPSVYGRLDLWTPGVELEDVIPILAGPITSSAFDRPNGGIRLVVDDGDTERTVKYPPGDAKISLDDFPDAPDLVVGRAGRQTIFGPFIDPIPAIPISRDGRRWYLCEPACVAPPTGFQIGGVEVGSLDRPTVRTGRLLSDPSRTYTEIVFPDSAAATTLQGWVTASGGLGLATESAALTLLRDIGRYEISPAAERDLVRVASQFDFTVLLNNSGDVYGIVRDRLLPQTDLVLTQHLNQIHTLQLRGQTSSGKLAVGQGIWQRVDQEQSRTTAENVWNVIEVLYRRSYLSIDPNSPLTRSAYVVDQNYGGSIGALLAESQRLYGRRELTIEAADLITGPSGGLPRGVVRLAENTAILSATPIRPVLYDLPWIVGLGLDLNDLREITDPDLGYADEPMRLVSYEVRPAGIRTGWVKEPQV